MSRSAALTLQWVALVACGVVLVCLATSAWRSLAVTVNLLDRVGWSTLVRRPPTRPVEWVIGCWMSPTCPSMFAAVWAAHFPFWLAVAGAGLGSAAVILRGLANRARPQSELPPGAARWAHQKELSPFIRGELASPQRGYLGILAPRRPPGWMCAPPVLRLPERLRCSHCLVVGGSGARKTTGYHKPNILLDAMEGVSVVIFDLKYPDPRSGFWDCVPYFARRGYDVQLFLPFDRQTLALPLLGDVRTLEDAYDVVDLLLPPPLQDNPANFYRDQERQLLVGLLLGVVGDHCRTPDDPFAGPPSVRRLFRYCLAGIREIERYVHTHPDARVREAVAGLFELEDRLLAGIAAGVAGRLQLFNDDRLDRATSPPPDSRLRVRLTQLGTAPTLLYIGIPQERVQGARGQLLLQLVKRTVERTLLQTADRHGGALPHHVSIYLDDFATMGPLPNVSEMMATMRSRRVAYHLSLQNRAHGELLYGPTGFRSFFVNNIQTVIIFPRYLKFDDAAYFSEMLGYMTVEQRSMGLTRRGVFGGSRTDWSRETLRPLLPPEEYPDWPEAMGILFTIGARPVRVLLPRIDEDQVAGVRNPLLGFRQYLVATGDEASREQLISELVRGHLAWVDAHQPSSSGPSRPRMQPQTAANVRSFPPSAEGSPTASGDSTEPARWRVDPASNSIPLASPAHSSPGDGGGAAVSAMAVSLHQWVDGIIEGGLPPGAVKTYFHNRRLTRIGFHRVTLPAALSVPTLLNAWIAQGWVRVNPGEIGLLPRALRLLPRDSLATLRRAGTPQRGRAPQPGRGESPAPPAPLIPSSTDPQEADRVSAIPRGAAEAMDHLCAWVNAHGQHFEGHPQRDPTADLLGVYRTGQAVMLRVDVLRHIFAAVGIPLAQMPGIRAAWRKAGWIRADADHLTTVRRLGGRRCRVIEVLWECWAGSRGEAGPASHPSRDPGGRDTPIGSQPSPVVTDVVDR